MTSHSESHLPLAREHQDSAKSSERDSDPELAQGGLSSDLDDEATGTAVGQDEVDQDEVDQDESEENGLVTRDPRRPAFLDELPESELLEPLVAAFIAGNYGRLRELANALGNHTNDSEILEAARELVARTEPDPLSKKLLGLSILFFVCVVGWVYLYHAH